MPPKIKNKTTQASQQAAAARLPHRIDPVAVQAQWSPNREQRILSVPRQKKIRSARKGPLRGGDWVLNEAGGGATLSFVFQFEGSAFGLTVGHLANVGDSVFCFSDSVMLEDPLPEGEAPSDPSMSYYTFEIGSVISKSTVTDSLVFEIADHIDIAPFRTMAPESGVTGPLVLPDPNSLPPRPMVGDTLVGFGAQRRGALVAVASPTEAFDGLYSRVGNIRVVDPGDSTKTVTDIGDCGTIFVGLDGTAFYFHHCGNTRGPRFSYGFPLAQVMACHTQLGGESEETDEDEDEAPEVQQQQQQLLPADDTLATNQSAGLKTNHGDATLSTDQNQSAGLMQFRTVIVAAPEPSYEANVAFQNNSLASFGPVKVATHPKAPGKTDSTE